MNQIAAKVVAFFESNNQSSRNLEPFGMYLTYIIERASLFRNRQHLQQVYINNEQEAVYSWIYEDVTGSSYCPMRTTG